MKAFTNFGKRKGTDGGAAAAQFLANKGGQEGLTQSMTNGYSTGGLSGLIEKGKEAATDFQKISGHQGALPSVSDMLKQAPTGKQLPDLIKQAQAATGEIPPELMKQAQAATGQIPPDLIKQAQAATVQIPPELSTVIQEAGTAVPTPPPSGKASAPTSVSNPSESESELKAKEAEKKTSKAAESKAKEATKALTNAEKSADSDSKKIKELKELEKSQSESEAKIKALEASLNEQKAKTAAAEQAKTPLAPDGLKKKINDEYFNNLHLFFGKKHLVTLCETIDPFLKLEEHQEVVILPSELEKQNKITEILLALVRNMIYNFSRGDVISGGGTLDQLKKIIKKRISDIKPKFIS